MRYILATPNVRFLKMFSREFRWTAHPNDLWLTMRVDARDKTVRNRFPPNTIWVTPTVTEYYGFSNNQKESVISIPPRVCENENHADNEVYKSFKHSLDILENVQLYQHVDWVVVTPFGGATYKTVKDMHSAYVNVTKHKQRLNVFRHITSDR
jgi:hypothetical protein